MTTNDRTSCAYRRAINADVAAVEEDTASVITLESGAETADPTLRPLRLTEARRGTPCLKLGPWPLR